jgi:hypothetical protein
MPNIMLARGRPDTSTTVPQSYHLFSLLIQQDMKESLPIISQYGVYSFNIRKMNMNIYISGTYTKKRNNIVVLRSL